MIKIFQGAGVVTPSKPPPPYKQLLPLPTPCFKMFLERSLNDPPPPPPHFKHLSLLPPTPSTTPSPPKNFDHTHSGGLGLLISKAQSGSYVTIANNSSNLFPEPDLKFPSSKSNYTDLNKWYVISVMWSNKKNLSNCWSNGIKITTFSSGDAKVLITASLEI